MTPSRRRLLAGLAAGPLLAFAPARADPIVDTPAGRLRGGRTGGAIRFLGIPYGAPTGDHRFCPPRPAPSWPGMRDADRYGDQSPQLTLGLGEASILRGFAIPRPDSEDCLTLNVWAPEPGGRPRPVMVWLHGGGFVAGSGASRVTDGTRLAARHGVVVVTINHRLGPFGHLWFPPGAGADFARAGNVGMLDIILALRWVRDSIAMFGGDPGNVTIFGESGGGCKVSTLMAMPAARGLFHKAIVQSGSLIRAHTLDSAAEMTRIVMAEFGLRPHEADRLARMPYATIAPVLPAIARRVGWRMGPVLGDDLPTHPFDPAAPMVSRDVPLLIGATRDESTLIAGALDPTLFTLDEAELGTRLARLGLSGEAVHALRAAMPGARPSDVYFRAASWMSVRRNATIMAERKAAAGGAPSFAYLLAWQTPVEGGRWKSPHALDLPLVFDSVTAAPQLVGTGRAPQRVADAMSTAWARFARSGDPGWPRYDAGRRATMRFDARSAVVDDPDSAERVAMRGPPVDLLSPRR